MGEKTFSGGGGPSQLQFTYQILLSNVTPWASAGLYSSIFCATYLLIRGAILLHLTTFTVLLLVLECDHQGSLSANHNYPSQQTGVLG